MKDLNVIVYTMKGCPFCVDFKKMLKEEGVEFFDRDIDEHKDEYDIFSEITDNDMIPALLIKISRGLSVLATLFTNFDRSP